MQGTRSNRDAIGARIEITIGDQRQMREVVSTGGYISSRSLMSHFGLGKTKVVDSLIVHWPAGGRTLMKDVPANQLLMISEPSDNHSRPSK